MLKTLKRNFWSQNKQVCDMRLFCRFSEADEETYFVAQHSNSTLQWTCCRKTALPDKRNKQNEGNAQNIGERFTFLVRVFFIFVAAQDE